MRRAERYLQVALEEAAEHGFQQEEAASYLALGKVCIAVPRRLEARAYLEQAKDLADLLGDEDLALASLEALGQLAHEEGDAPEAARLYQLTLDRAGESSEVAVRALLGLANHALRLDQLDEATATLERALVQAERLGDRILLGRAVNNLGITHHTRGEYPQALECFERALRIREGIGYLIGTIVNHHNIGDSWLRMDDLARAHGAFLESMKLAQDANWQPGVTMNALFLGYLDAERGDLEGLQRLEEAIRAARHGRNLSLVASGLWLQARWAARQGQQDTATAAFDQAIQTARDGGDSGLVRELLAERAKELA